MTAIGNGQPRCSSGRRDGENESVERSIRRRAVKTLSARDIAAGQLTRTVDGQRFCTVDALSARERQIEEIWMAPEFWKRPFASRNIEGQLWVDLHLGQLFVELKQEEVSRFFRRCRVSWVPREIFTAGIWTDCGSVRLQRPRNSPSK